LYEFLGYDRSNWAKWYKSYIVEKPFALESEDWVGFVLNTNGNETRDFAISIDFAKRISMMAKTQKGHEARTYFIGCESKAIESKFNIPQTFKEALLLAVHQQEIIEQQQALIAESAPKAEFYDQVTGSKDCIDMAEVAKVCNLGVGRNKMFQFLRDEKILQHNNSPYQTQIDQGHMRMVESKYTKPDGSVCINLKTVVMQKGVDFIIKRWNKCKNKI